MGKIILTPKQERWLILHYKHTKNDEIMSRLGLSHSALHRIIRVLGLSKSKQFMRKCQAEGVKKAWETNQARGYPPKGYQIPNRHNFEKGLTPEQRFGKKRNAERIAKAAASRNETIRKDRLRLK